MLYFLTEKIDPIDSINDTGHSLHYAAILSVTSQVHSIKFRTVDVICRMLLDEQGTLIIFQIYNFY